MNRIEFEIAAKNNASIEFAANVLKIKDAAVSSILEFLQKYLEKNEVPM